MKKNKFLSLLCAAMAMLAIPTAAFAQGSSAIYGNTRVLQVMAPTTMIAGGVNVSNLPVDLHVLEGTADLIITVQTNGNGLVSTIAPYVSNDLTNWTLLSNFSIATNTSVLYTNVYYATSIKATNNYILPGKWTSAVPSVQGFAGTYLDYAFTPFTNAAAITTSAAGGIYVLGFNVDDAPRYLNLTITGSNNCVAAVIVSPASRVP